YQLSLSNNGEKLVFSSLHDGGFDLFLLRQPIDRALDVAELEKTAFFSAVYDTAAPPRLRIRPDTVNIGADLVLKTSTEATDRKEPDGGLNLRNYVFRKDFQDTLMAPPDSTPFPEVTGNVDEEGNYLVNKYRLNFSPDIIYGNAGYNTFYGVEGSTIMAFSDMLGDHQIYLITNLLFDLKNSDYALAYLYLPKRIDYGIQAFHSARAVILQSEYGETFNRFRNYGVGLFALYPLTKFTRFDFGLSWLNVTRENLDLPFEPTDRSMVVLPSVGYVHDTSIWGLIAPANGERFNVSVMASPKISDNAPTFYGFQADFRRYFRLGENYTFALRLAGGGSFGEN
ncbi:MAG TPA: hypothetical protein VLA34_05020, partial [Candidatus Krumholzibacterium sp.]|nr:hypothetical protein [Candidatus Krumholzibacterium sp.]